MTAAAVTHQLTADEAHAICAVLNALEHIPVGALVAERGEVHVWPVGRELTLLEEVSAVRAFCSVTDARVRWYPVVS
ncbi:MAG: hypothetical protein JWO11_4464 [Nocardioides sp.]|nr:hypothetical protein [Nocardioides sp.]